MTALTVLQIINRTIGVLFLLCYFYQLLYVPVALRRKKRPGGAAPLRRYAVLISARNEQAVISPSWSIHSGCGSRAYTFIWGMVGENQDFDDMDGIAMKDLM